MIIKSATRFAFATGCLTAIAALHVAHAQMGGTAPGSYGPPPGAYGLPARLPMTPRQARMAPRQEPIPRRAGYVPLHRLLAAEGYRASVLIWRERLVCSKCGGRQANMVVTGTKRR